MVSALFALVDLRFCVHLWHCMWYVQSERPMLERAHMYSVDKQQVSIIQVGGEKPDPSPLQRSPSLGGRSQIMPTQGEKQLQGISNCSFSDCPVFLMNKSLARVVTFKKKISMYHYTKCRACNICQLFYYFILLLFNLLT